MPSLGLVDLGKLHRDAFNAIPIEGALLVYCDFLAVMGNSSVMLLFGCHVHCVSWERMIWN